jgi:hypothetical protein
MRNEPFSLLPTLAKGTLKITEKCGVATAIFERGQEESEGLRFKAMADNFTVKFGRTARTLNYEDAQGHITFTFDLAADGSLVLETGGDKQRVIIGPRFDVAVNRAKKYIESCGYVVEIYDPAKGTSFDWNAFFLEQERAGFNVERKSNGSVVVSKKAKRGFLSRISIFFQEMIGQLKPRWIFCPTAACQNPFAPLSSVNVVKKHFAWLALVSCAANFAF